MSLKKALIYNRNNPFIDFYKDIHNRVFVKRAFQDAWTNAKKDGLEQLIKEKLPKVEEKKIDDLLIILEHHFDPEKKPKAKLAPEKKGLKSKSSEKVNDDKENNNKCDSGTESPDTTTSASPVKMSDDDVEVKTL